MFNDVYSGKKVLITGNTGFKGSWLTLWLLKLGAKVFGVSKDIPTNPSMFEELNLSEKIEYHQFDLRDYKEVNNTVNIIKPDFVFHLAAQSLVAKSYTDPLNTISSNVLGTTHVLEALRNYNNPCVAIIITSDKCYDNVEWVWGYREIDKLGGKDIYSGSKASAELIFNSYYQSFFKDQNKSRIRAATVRAGNVIGGGDWADFRIIPDCMRAWSQNNAVHIRNPYSIRPWQHVLEPLSGYLWVGANLFESNNFNGQSFNFGPKSEYSITVQDLIRDMAKYWKFKNPEKAYTITESSEFYEAGLLKLSCDKAYYYLKWSPTLDYDNLIKFTSIWYYLYYNDKDINMYDFTTSQISSYEQIAGEKGIIWTR